MAWAIWPKGRLVALEAPVEGSFRTFPLETEKRTIHLNFKTPPGGYVQVQVTDRRYQPLPGRSFDDCDWLIGDQIDRQVSWNGETDLGHDGKRHSFPWISHALRRALQRRIQIIRAT